MWRQLNLRARILIGYSVVLALAAALALFLMIQVDGLNQRIAVINASSASDAEAGAYLASNVTSAQQAVDLWLQDPRDATKADATAALDQLADEIERTQPRLASVSAQRHLRELGANFVAYRTTVTTMGVHLDEQLQLRRDLRTAIFQSASLANIYAGDLFYREGSSKFSVLQLFDAQESLQLASILADRLAVEQTASLSMQAQRELKNAEFNLRLHLDTAPNDKLLQTAVLEVSKAITSTQRLERNLDELKLLRAAALIPQSRLVRESADAIAADALAVLTAATQDLQRQVARTQQLAGAALVAMVALTILAGLRLARSLAHPIVDLAGAVDRVNSGDYEVSVPHTEGGEIGRLAEAFNQMTLALRRQRDEVRAQQLATTQRNRELEQALAEVQAATAAREELASAMRAMSVPVVPILDNVIVVPLVGEIDEQRAQVLLERMLAGITEEHARIVILDITGVPFVDATLAGWILQAAGAAELLGSRCMLVGISPEVAQALVMSGADLRRVHTYADLRAGVAVALRETRVRA